MKFTHITMATVLGALLPIAALAATYQYVDVNGNLQAEDANSADQALAVAPYIAPTSGVMEIDNSALIMGGNIPVGGEYQYVNTGGNIETENAIDANDAIADPSDIAPTSGVLAVTPTTVLPPTEVVNVSQ